MPKKKPQTIEEPDVTAYNIETILKRATIIIRAIATEEWTLSYDASRGLYSVLQIVLEGRKARHYINESLVEVLLFMVVYRRNPKIGFYEDIGEPNITRISERQVPTKITLEARTERRLREAACYFDLPDGAWMLTLSELYRSYKREDNAVYHFSKVRYSEADPIHLYSGIGLRYCLLSFLLKNALVIEDPTKYNVVDFDLFRERKAKQGGAS